MGLKTTNYMSKSTGLMLPTAYAKLSTFMLNSDNSITATFSIHISREALDGYKPVEVIVVNGGKWDRNMALQEAAYTMAKTEKRTEIQFNEETYEGVPVVVYGALYGWDDDIVTE